MKLYSDAVTVSEQEMLCPKSWEIIVIWIWNVCALEFSCKMSNKERYKEKPEHNWDGKS